MNKSLEVAKHELQVAETSEEVSAAIKDCASAFVNEMFVIPKMLEDEKKNG